MGLLEMFRPSRPEAPPAQGGPSGVMNSRVAYLKYLEETSLQGQQGLRFDEWLKEQLKQKQQMLAPQGGGMDPRGMGGGYGN